MGLLIPLSGTSGHVYPRFQSQGGIHHLHVSLPIHDEFLKFTFQWNTCRTFKLRDRFFCDCEQAFKANLHLRMSNCMDGYIFVVLKYWKYKCVLHTFPLNDFYVELVHTIGGYKRGHKGRPLPTEVQILLFSCIVQEKIDHNNSFSRPP